MPKSMTGFGAADGAVGGGRLHVELKTVNHRHFNPQLKLPHVLTTHESEIRDYLRGRIDRGHVTVSGRWLEEAVRPTTIEVDPDRAAEYRGAFSALASELGTDDVVSLEFIARQPDVLVTRTADLEPIPWGEIQAVLADAADGLDAAREREGRVLGVEIDRRLAGIRQSLEAVVSRAPERLDRERTRLQEAVRELTDGHGLEEGRLAQEIAVLADKLDVTEETVRLEAHLDACVAALATAEPIGKQLGFLGQEMLREINTIGSKANDAEIAHLVVAMKGELEKYREQVENLE